MTWLGSGLIGRWPAPTPAGVQQAPGVQRRSARLRTSGIAAERTLALARLFLRKMGLGLRAVLDGPGPVLRHLRASGFAPGEQSRAARLRWAGFRGEASREEKAVSRISVWGFADFELINSPRGNFRASLTSFPKKPLKRAKIRDTETKETKAFDWHLLPRLRTL